MSGSERFVVLGLAQVRAGWFREVARWATGGAVPVEFVMCLSADELRIRLASGRVHSALLLDGGLPAADRSLLAAATGRGCAVLVVDAPNRPTDWLAAGAHDVLDPAFDREDLLRSLRRHARPVRPTEGAERPDRPPASGGGPGSLIAVTGPGGTGTSTAAMALAAALATDHDVVLADLARRADHAVLHDVGDVLPGLPELVEAHRRSDPDVQTIRALSHRVGPYDVLLGLRRPRDWTALSPDGMGRAVDSLRRSYDIVVADLTGDIEGERECGSLDVEERNAAARITLHRADAVVVVGGPGPKGIHTLSRLAADLAEYGVDGARVVTVINRGPRRRLGRRELATALGTTPIFLTERRDLDDRLRHGAGVPADLGAPLARAVARVLAACGPHVVGGGHPVALTPGRVGALSPAQP